MSENLQKLEFDHAYECVSTILNFGPFRGGEGGGLVNWRQKFWQNLRGSSGGSGVGVCCYCNAAMHALL